MHRSLSVVLLVALATMQTSTRLSGQQADQSSPAGCVKVYATELGLVPPQLLPLNIPPAKTGNCTDRLDGKVKLSALVDTDGVARNLMFVHPVGTDVDNIALKIAAADRFRPGTVNGRPVVVAVSLEIKIQSCLIEAGDINGKVKYSARLRSAPVQQLRGPVNQPTVAILSSETYDWEKFAKDHPREQALKNYTSGVHASGNKVSGPNFTNPVPILQPEATYTDEAVKNRIHGTCLVSLIIDSQGMPQDLKIEKSLDPGLDQNAIYAASKFRFKPAMKDGEPIPVWAMVQVNFLFP